MEYLTVTGYVAPVEYSERKFVHSVPDPLVMVGGYATRYWNMHVYKGRIEVFPNGCFDESIRPGHSIGFWIDHEPDQEVGRTEDGLELLSDPDGLSFRFSVPDTPLGRQVTSMISAGKGTSGMSVGYKVLEESWITIEGQRVRVLRKCELKEISICKVGAVPGAFVNVSDRQRISDTKMACSAAALKVRWAFRDLEALIESLGAA